VNREAHALAVAFLGVAETIAELEAIVIEEAALDRRKDVVQRAVVATLRGVAVEFVTENILICYGDGLRLPIEVHKAITARQAAHQTELLAADPIGSEVARLRDERDQLLDVVWLASSSREMRQLWMKVSALLGEEPTQLERDALAIEPEKPAVSQAAQD
jgi:hypothetical protein